MWTVGSLVLTLMWLLWVFLYLWCLGWCWLLMLYWCYIAFIRLKYILFNPILFTSFVIKVFVKGTSACGCQSLMSCFLLSLFTFSQGLSLNSKLSNWASVESHFFLWDPMTLLSQNWFAISSWILYGFWGSKLWSSCLWDEYFIHRAWLSSKLALLMYNV